MAWPSLADYNAAFSRPAKGLLAASLKGAHPRLDPLGLVMPISGGFALVYELSLPGGQRRAVRCFSDEDPTRLAAAAEASRLLAASLTAAPSLRPHFAETLWLDECVEAGGRRVPALVMDWVEGQVLAAWLEKGHRDKPALAALRSEFADLAAALENRGIAHGDLQARNVLVSGGGFPVLIDYDELRIAGRSSFPSLEFGHPHFQHPAWHSGCDPARKDRFPLIALDLGLAALISRAELFDRFSTGENVLFVRDDYLDPAASPAFDALRDLPELAEATGLFAELCLGDPAEVPTLADFRKTVWGSGADGSAGNGGGDAAGALRGGERRRREIAAARGVSISHASGYRGPYPVHGGLDFAGILRAVGHSIEIVGRVRSLKADGRTKRGDPYVFVNFGDWRSDGCRLTIWSEGLGSFARLPDRSWEGRWISATGLIDEPYRNARLNTTQLSLTIRDSSQFRFITEAEARRRLSVTNLVAPA